MAVAVVVALEVVDVAQHQRQRLLVAPGAGDLLREPGVEGAPVHQARQRILAGKLLQPLVAVAQFIGHLLQPRLHPAQPLHRAQLGLQHGVGHRLDEVVVPARFDALPEILVAVAAGQEDDRRPAAALVRPHLAGDPVAVVTRHLDVQQHQVRALAVEAGQRAVAAVRLQGVMTDGLELAAQEAARAGLVVHDQDAKRRQRGGSVHGRASSTGGSETCRGRLCGAAPPRGGPDMPQVGVAGGGEAGPADGTTARRCSAVSICIS